MKRRERCWGKLTFQHIKACRPARPLCRWRRVRPCVCHAYHFPHRSGSGVCGDDVAYLAKLMTPKRRHG